MTKGSSPGRPDLVPVLKAMTVEELVAYCTAVLERQAGIPLGDDKPNREGLAA